MADPGKFDSVAERMRAIPMVPFHKIDAGSVFVIEGVAYLKLALEDLPESLEANAADLSAGRLHFIAADVCVRWPGGRL